MGGGGGFGMGGGGGGGGGGDAGAESDCEESEEAPVDVLPHLLRALRYDPVEKVRAAAAGTLHHVQGDEALSALLSSLLAAAAEASHDELVVRGAVASLARWAQPATLLHALRQAGFFGRPTARLPLARAAACEVLGHAFFGSAEGEARCRGTAAATERRQSVADHRHSSCSDRRQSGQAAATQRQDDDPVAAVADALAQAELPTAHALLVAQLDEKDEGVRLQAAWALGHLARPHALAPLTPLLRDPSVLVVETAINAINALDWAAFLQPTELLVLAGPILKRGGRGAGRAAPKQLLLTDKPRLFYVDAGGMAERACAAEVEVVAAPKGGGTAMMQLRKKEGKGYRTVKVQPVIHSAEKWGHALSALLHQARPGRAVGVAL